MMAPPASGFVCGIDCGLSGAVAILDGTGALVAVHDTPTLALQVARGTKQVYDIPGMSLLLTPYAGQHAHVVLEQAQGMPS